MRSWLGLFISWVRGSVHLQDEQRPTGVQRYVCLTSAACEHINQNVCHVNL